MQFLKSYNPCVVCKEVRRSPYQPPCYAKFQKGTTMNSDKIILDLCGGTGSWSKPYREAGYDVRVITHPMHDVFTYTEYKDFIEKVHGVLMAPTCTHFSLARTIMEKIRDEKVIRCIRVGEKLYTCVDDIPTLHGGYNGIYINEEKPWFHGKKCVIKSQCVAYWNEPLTDKECENWHNVGCAPESIIHHKEFVACAYKNLYVETDK